MLDFYELGQFKIKCVFVRYKTYGIKIVEYCLLLCVGMSIIFLAFASHNHATQMLAVLISLRSKLFFTVFVLTVDGHLMVAVYAFLLLYLLYWEKK
jgi:hypothetical protein